MECSELIGEEATRSWAYRLAERLVVGDVLLLEGPLGAGKTTLVRALVSALGGAGDRVSSPSFTLLHRYEARIPIVHIDAWRLGSAEELREIGFAELSADAITCIEWPGRVAGICEPRCCWRITLDHEGPGSRRATVRQPDRPVTSPGGEA